MATPASVTALRLDRLTLAYDGRRVWSDLTLDVPTGSFTAIIGPSGSGKTSLLRAILGLVAPLSGRLTVLGHEPRRGDPRIGYVPQQSAFDRDLALRGVDLVRFGVDGHRWGVGRRDRAASARVLQAIGAAGASSYALAPVGRLSGGEQQRLRIAQALVGDPRLLLCDEPLAHLDLGSQRAIVDVLGRWRSGVDGTVLFVTHDVNPVLHLVDRVLFLVNGRWAAGTPDEILTTDRLTDLYGSHVDVVRVHDRVLVVGESTGSGFEVEEPHHLPGQLADHAAPRGSGRDERRRAHHGDRP